MKKLFIVLSSVLFLGVAQATPPVEGDVLDGNNFVLGADINLLQTTKRNSPNAPYLYAPSSINGQRIALPTYTQKDKAYSDQFNALLDIYARYGILDYIEVFGNASGYYQISDSRFTDKHTNAINFANANIGVMATLYKGDAFRFIIGDNSDIISNTIFADSGSNIQLFKGHTFFINLIKRKEEEGKMSSFTAQFYYRLNPKQNHADTSLKLGNEYGANFLWQFAKGKQLGYIQGTVAMRDVDKINNIALDGGYGNSVGTGFAVGGKYDLSDHLGLKYDIHFMTYGLDYNASNVGITFGMYFK
ncbi:hypothetical protein BKH46_03945 [Helicobacter sp. 12S02634-8]|uniref:hypothetical protein n=1 Tax=Helicobacter sp. 12S02634-8 TaxID=1476199 RepID=UPI000BA6275E|nr:hypothetical protein [Helicobacter sp. 12S02634-8]PAF47585.1 hypothetical protein BKH46_03945 [Helicobacter sp. 12S02634-8]